MANFGVTGLPFRITEGDNFSFMLVPSSALGAGVTVRWEVILDGQLAASPGFFPSLSGTVDFDAGATDAQRVNIAINDDGNRSEDRNFSVRLIEVAGDGTETQIGDNHAVTLIDDDTAKSFAHIIVSNSVEHDTLVFGSSYTYNTVSGAAGADTFIITRHQRGNLSIDDALGSNVIKFDEGVSITAVQLGGFRTVITNMTITLGTGAEISIVSPRSAFSYQLGDGVLMDYTAFLDEVVGVALDLNVKTQLATPYAITDEPDTPSSNGGRNSQFTIPNLQDTITEGNNFSFMLTPSSALDAGVTVRWEVILDGQLAASSGFFPSLSGTVTFGEGAITGQTVTIAINDDPFISEDRNFSVRLIEVAGDGTETRIGEDHAVILIDDDTSKSFANIVLPSTGDHDTFVFGSSYTYRSASGGAGDDTYIVTRHQRGDVSIDDALGSNVIKFEEGVSITAVQLGGFRTFITNMTITLGTGAEISIASPRTATSYQLGDGVLMDYTAFLDEVVGVALDLNVKTQLATPYAITDEPDELDTPSSNGGGNSQFTFSDLQDTITEGNDFSFMLTPSSALDAGVTVRWEVILDGQLAASSGFFPSLSGTVTFGEGAITGQTVTIAINDDPFISEDRNFSVRLIEVAADGTETQIGEDHAVTLIDDDTSKSFANVSIYNTGDHDTLVFGSSYTYRSVSGAAGDDTFIITRHQRGDLSINDQLGEHIIKFDEGVEITHVDQSIRTIRGVLVTEEIALTLDTGAVITVERPASVGSDGPRYRYQLGDGEAQIYADFYAELIAGGFEAGSTTQLATPYTITDEPDTPSSDGGGNSQFTIPNLQDTITEGNDFSFMLTPSSALDAGVTVRWEVILDGRLAASSGFFPSLSGTVDFDAGATDAQRVNIAINDDPFISEDRNFSVRLIEVAADGTKTQIGEDHAVTLIDDDTSKSFANVLISNTGDHDTLVFGSSYTYSSVEGAAGDDTFIITRHQRGDLSIDDRLGGHIIKFDEGVEITHVDQSIRTFRGRMIIDEIELTLDTGAVITVNAPASVASGVHRYRYQLGDGEAQIYADFYAELIAGGFEAGSTTQLATPVIAGGLNALPNNGGRDKFTVTNLQDTVEEGDDFSFMLTPSSALVAGTTVRWEIVLDGKLPASPGFFPLLSGTVTFGEGATDAQRVNIAINDDLFISEDRSFSVRLTEVAADGTKTQIGEDHAVTLIDDDTSRSFANIFIPATGEHDTLVFGSSYTYRSVSGAAGDDTFIITRHQRGDLSINDPDGQHIIKFDEGVEITHVDQSIRTIRNRMVIDEIALTLDTGGVITVMAPASGVHRYRYQLGDGEAQLYADFYAKLIAGGFEAGSTTQLATPYAITDEPDTPSSDGGGNSQFTIPNLQDTITEGNDFSFMLTPSSALGAGVTVRWEVILDGQLAASAGFFPALSGTVTFQAGARAGQTITIAINDDPFISEDRNFSVRLIEVAGDGRETQIGEDHAVTLIDDDTSKSFANVSISNTGDHDTLVFGSSYTYRSVEGAAGDDTFIITRHQRGDLSIHDQLGEHIIKFDEGVEITHVDQSIRTIRNRMVIDEIALTLDTGAVITVEIPASVTNGVHRYRYQLGDGEAQIYADFYADLIAGGFEAGSTTQLATPVIAGGLNALPNNGGRDKFTVTNLQDTITEGNDFSFMLTPSSALDAGVTVRWEIVLDGQLAASPGFFPSLSGTVDFDAGATDAQRVTIAINDDPYISEDRNFSVRLIEVAADGTKTQIGEDHAVTLIDDDTSKSFANISISNTGEHDTLVFGSSYTYRSVSGAGGDDTFIITRHQRGDLSITDPNGQHIIKFDEGVEITHVDQSIRTIRNRMVIDEIALTLDTGGVITVRAPASVASGVHRYRYQIGDGEAQIYADFYAELIAGGFEAGSTTQLATPYAITDEPDTPSSDGGGNSQFTIPNLQDTITEGNDFSFMLTPSSALDAGVTVRWEVILDGQLAASAGFFPALSGTVTFQAGARAGQTITIAINDDPFISEDRNFSVRLIEVAADGTKTQIGEDHAVTLIDDDTSKSFANVSISNTGDHDTLVFGSSYTYRSVEGLAGDDTFIITRHQRGDLSINDQDGQHIIKFDEGVEITHVDQSIVTIRNRMVIDEIALTLDTGAVITVEIPASVASGVHRYRYQLGDGEVQIYADFHAELIAGGFEAGSTTQLATPYAITGGPNALPNNGGRDKFTVTNLQDTITEGNDFSFMLTPSSALDAGVTVRWEVILDGQLAASPGFFPSLSGTIDFEAGATDAQRVNITINDDPFISEDRNFSVRLTEVVADGTETQIGEDHAVTLIDDDTSRSFANIFIPNSGEHDTFVLGSSYTYRSVVGAAGDDTFIITRHQRGDLSITDPDGQHIIKFDEGVEITHVEQEFRIVFGGRQVISEVSLTLDTGAVITVQSPTSVDVNGRHVYRYQLGDGEAQIYTDFYAELIAGGFEDGSTTQLATPYAITDEPDTPSSDGGGNSQFTIPNLQDTITEGNDFSFMLTPSSALDARVTVRWEVILDGQLAASSGFFPSLSGTVGFDAGATDAQRVTIAINDDGDRSEDRSFSVRLIEVAGDGTKTQIGEDHAVTLIDDDTSRAFANIIIPNTSDHDTLVFGSSYTYRSVSGAGGDDTFIITRHQRGDLSINDLNGEHIIKFDKGVEITHVNQIFRTVFSGRMVVSEVALTLDTGAVITVDEPASTTSNIHRYRYQLGDGEAQVYTDFYAELIAGGFEAGSDTQLATPYAITGGPNALPNNGGRDKFTVANLQDTITEGDDFSFMLTPSSALDEGVMVRWEVILDGQLAASPGFFPSLSGTVDFEAGATDAQRVNITINDDTFISEDRNFSVRLIEVAADGTKTQIGEDHAVTLIDDDTSRSFATITLAASGEHDTLVFGSSYTYRSVSGAAGDDTFIITRHQRGNLSIGDSFGSNVIKFDEGNSITAVELKGFARFINNMTITLGTGAEISIGSPRSAFSYQLGDGVLMDHAAFLDEVVGVALVTNVKTQLATPYAITDEPDTPSSNGGGNSQFTIPDLQDTITEGNDFSFMLTPSLALDAGVTVRWEVILDGQLAASPGFFPSLSGTVNFDAGATDAQRVNIAINDDLFISEDRNFSVRLIEVAGDGTETQIGNNHAVTLIDDDTTKSFAHISFSSSGNHDTLVFGSSYTYRSVSGAGGNDTFIITRHQRGDLSIIDTLGSNVMKFDEGSSITAVQLGGFRTFINSMTITLGTGAEISIASPRTAFSYQLGDGVLMDHAAFLDEVVGVDLVANVKTELATPYVITGGPNALPNNEGRDKFTVANLQDTITEGDDFSFMLTPSSALGAGVTVRWEVILDGQLAASPGFFPSLSGTVDFEAGATDAQRVNITINDDTFISEDRNFSVRLIEVAADGTKTQIGEDHAVTLIDDDTTRSFAHITLSASGEHDTLVFGSSYTYRPASGGAGDDTYIVTKHQRGNLSIGDPFGSNVIKFDEGSSITAVELKGFLTVITDMIVTLGTGAEISIGSPRTEFSYQLGDGVLMDYAAFLDEVVGVALVTNVKTHLATPYAITDEPDTPSSNGGGNSQFTIPDLQDTITEGKDFSFMLTPSLALDAGVTVRWEVILDGQLAASPGFFPSLSGTVNFDAGATDAQRVNIAINDDSFISEDRNFSVRLIEVAGDGTETQIGDKHAVTLIDNDGTTRSFAHISLSNSSEHDTLVLGSSYTYGTVSGAAGDDTFIITRHQRGDLSISDAIGSDVIKFEEGVSITAIQLTGFGTFISNMTITLGTGAEISIASPRSAFSYQLGDGVLIDYAAFLDEVVGVDLVANVKTEFATPYVITDEPELPAVVNFALEQERLIEEGYYHISVTGQINVSSEGPVNTPIAVTYTVDGDTDGDNSVTVNNVRFTIENDGSWIAEVVADLGVASDRDTIRTFTVRADDGDARTATAEIDVRTKFNGMTILDANADASAFASTLTGQIDQIYIGSRGADGRDANGQPDPVLTHGGRDVIIGLEGDDAFQLGHNQEDTIYQRFSSSGSNWYNNDGADTYTNYVRATATAPDKFVFVDIDGTVVNKADFVAHTSVELFADVTVNSGVITITGFEIRFLNPDSSVQSTISIDYSTVFQPIATNPADFGLAGITTSGTHMVTIDTEAVWNRYFGEGAEAFQVIGNDDLPSIITELVPDAAPVPGAPTAITADTATVVYDGDVPPAGMTIARLTTTDIDAGDTHIYAITGGTHASSFSINGNELQFAAQNAVNRDLMEMWNVQVTSTDSRGLMVEKTFTFTRGVALNVVTEESAPKADALTLGGIIFTSASEGDGAAAGDDGIPQINVEIVVSDAVNGRSVSAGTPEFAISDTTADVITLTITIAQTGDTPWSAIGNLIEGSLPDAVGVISFDSINSATTNIDKRAIENGGAIGTHTLSGGEGVPDALNIGGLLITARQAGESGMDGTPQLNFTLLYEADRGDIVLKDLFLPSDYGGNGEPIIIVTAGPSATWADIAAAINADSDASSYVNVRATDPTGLFTAADATVPPAGALHKLVLGPNDDLTITRNADAAELPIISLGFGSFSDYIYLNTDDLEGGTAPISISLASDVPEEGAGVRTWADFATFINSHVGVGSVESRASTYITATSSSNAIIARESFNSFASVPVITTVPLTGGANVESVELPTGTALLSANFNPQAAGNADNDELGTTASRGWAVRNLDPEVPEDIPLTPDMKDIGPLRVIAVNEGLSSVPNDGIPVITFGINFNQAVTAEEGARVKVLPTADGNYLVSIQLHQFTQQQRDAGMGTTWNDIRDVISTDMGTEDAPGAARLIRTEAIGTDAELNTMITRIPAGTTGVLGLPAEGGTLGAGLPEVVEVLLTPDITDIGPLRIISVNEGLSSVPNDGIPVITFAIDFDQVVTAEEETRVNVLPSTSGNYTVFIQLHRFTQQQQDAGMGTTWNDIRDVISADMGTEDAPGAARLIRTEAIGTDAELNTIITIIPTRDLTPGAGLPEVASTADSLLVGANGELRITSRVEGDNTAPGVPAIQFSLTVNGSPGSELIILTDDTDPELQTINITIARDNTETDWDGIVALIEGSDVANRLVSVELTGDFGDQVIEAEDETSSTTVMLAGGNNAQDYVPAVEGAPAVLAVMAADEEITTINKDAVGLLIGTLSDGERSTRFEILYNEDDPSQNDEDERVFVVDNDDQLYYIGGDTGDAGDEYTLTVRAYDGPTPDDFTQEYEYVVSVGPDMTDGADAAPPVADGKARFEVTSSGNINAAVVGDVLTVSRITSDPNGDGTLGYQWQRDGTDISDGTGGSASYTIVAADVGTPLAVAVNYIDGGNTHELVIAPGVVAPALFEVPDTEIEGTAGDDRGVTSLTGTGNAELIQGGSGNDNIVPGGGGDVVIGGYGDDNIVLGAGDATVIYRFESDAQADGAWRATDGADQIFNFQHGVDKLILVDVSSDNPVNDLAGFIADSGKPDVSLAILGTGRNNSDGVEIRAVFSLFITFDLAGVAGGRGLTIGFNESTRPIIDPLDEASVDHYISGTSLTSYEFLDDLLGTTETFTALEMVKEIDLPSDLIIL